jgi:hypothetical protein
MTSRSQEWHEGVVSGKGVSNHLARIEALKESLKYARGLSEEMSLLSDLTEEISALRQLNEPQYQ